MTAADPTTSVTPLWERRCRAPLLGLPRWARHAPERLVLASNESCSWQLYAWDRAAGTRRKVTDIPIGTRDGTLTPDGGSVVWFDDRTGDERGQWLAQPFDGGGPARPLADGMPDAWASGLAIGDH